MIKKLMFTSDSADLSEAHAGGGCLLPNSLDWPKDENGESLLHLLTIPAGWLLEKSEGWISIFTPFYLVDTYLHWEELTSDGKNQSLVIYHDNDGPARNDYSKEISPARKVICENANEEDSDKNFQSKIYGIPAWLQDREAVEGHNCFFAISGDDVDIAFSEEPGIFSDGVVYVFLKQNFQVEDRPSIQGKITFQFT